MTLLALQGAQFMPCHYFVYYYVYNYDVYYEIKYASVGHIITITIMNYTINQLL